MTGMNPRGSPEVCCLLSAGLLTQPGERQPGKPEWAGMLAYVAELHRRSIRPAEPPFRLDWEEIGPGYCYGPAFGHIDLVHQVLDMVAGSPAIARNQMLNLLALQRGDGSLPFVWMGENPARTWLPPGTPVAERLKASGTFPPLWPVSVEACLAAKADEELLTKAYDALCRLLAWFDADRKLPDGGYFYEDIRGGGKWESGMDQGIRFADSPAEPAACVDATSHVFWCRQFAAAWAPRLGRDAGRHEQAAAALREFIQHRFYCEDTAWFHDAWTVNDPPRRHLAFEGMWPLVVGAATQAQAARALAGSLLNPERFNTPHPIATVARCDPCFSRCMWRGPAWNCMTLWAAEACLGYGRPDGARELLKKALDATARVFARTRTVWEFYDSLGGEPERLERKPHTQFNRPCRDYLGHNPLQAMARLWASLTAAS